MHFDLEFTIKDHGTILPTGNTERFYLQLSQSYPYPVAVEVKVMVDGKCLGHKPVIINYGSSTSGTEYIKVGTAHKGKKYTLVAKVKEGRGTYDDNM